MLELNSRLKHAIAVPPVSAIDVCRNNLASGNDGDRRPQSK
jgi:hypothetical protein